MKHPRYDHVKTVVNAGLPVLLLGESGSGKSTICSQLAEDLKLPFYAMSMTRQTSVNNIVGFKTITDNYSSSAFRQAYEHGGLFLLDELDAGDANVLLTFNTIENGYMVFPDKIIHAHADFRLIATANPQEAHNIYTGRSKLDFSTLNRYYKVSLDRDPDLERSLTSEETATMANVIREFLASNGSSIQMTMRDTIRLHKIKQLKLDANPEIEVVFQSDPSLGKLFLERLETLKAEAARRQAEAEEAKKTQHETTTFDAFTSKILGD